MFIEKMSAQDLINLKKFQQLAEEASEAEEILKATSPCATWECELTVDNSTINWCMQCTTEDIFELLRDAYLLESNQATAEEKKSADKIAKCFRKFVEDSKDEIVSKRPAHQFMQFIKGTTANLE